MHPAARIIDANANRAREALRVMEDVARFVLDDADLCADLKTLRHDLAAAISAAAAGFGGEAALLAWRDTPGDVGTTVTTDAESRRPGLRAVAAAAGKRLTEALRSIEECAKIGQASAPAAAAIEGIRYRAYELERRLMTSLGVGEGRWGDGGWGGWRLCVLITESLCVHHPWERVAEEAIAGGADCLQLREKTLEGGELLRRARRLVEIAKAAAPGRVAVVVNDRPDVALLAGADGVHVGQGDLPVREVRRIAGDRLLVGVSTTNLDQARRAAADGADLCGVGPMFETTTKHKPVVAGVAYLREYLACIRLPHLAIGGITPANVSALWSAGCRGVAVSSCVCAAERPAEVCRALLSSWDGRGPTPLTGA